MGEKLRLAVRRATLVRQLLKLRLGPSQGYLVLPDVMPAQIEPAAAE
jgi:hypothetical protein